MTQYLVYHSVARMGYVFGDRSNTSNSLKTLSVVTKKNLRVEKGDVVWVISGEKRQGQPTEYRLECRFFIDRKTAVADRNFSYQISGRGMSYGGGIRLNELPWFGAFLKSQNNFRGGMQSLRSMLIQCLEAAARSAATNTEAGS